jgi:hypothetical protein
MGSFPWEVFCHMQTYFHGKIFTMLSSGFITIVSCENILVHLFIVSENNRVNTFFDNVDRVVLNTSVTWIYYISMKIFNEKKRILLRGLRLLSFM